MVLRQEKARIKTLHQGKVPVIRFNTRERCNCRGNSDCETLDGALETAMDTMMSLTDKYKETRE